MFGAFLRDGEDCCSSIFAYSQCCVKRLSENVLKVLAEAFRGTEISRTNRAIVETAAAYLNLLHYTQNKMQTVL